MRDTLLNVYFLLKYKLYADTRGLSNANKRAQVFLSARIFNSITYKLKQLQFQLIRNETSATESGKHSSIE